MGDTVYNQKNIDFKKFYDRLKSMVPQLRNYVTYSLLAAENLSLIDRSYYDPDGVLDQVYLTVFKENDSRAMSQELKHVLYRKSLESLEKLIMDEEYTPNDPSTSGFLKAELDRLEKKFTKDADGDWMFQEELDDISYKQDRKRSENIYLDDALVEQLVLRFELEDKFIAAENKRYLGLIYNSIPSISRSIMELYTYGRLEVKDITEILQVEEASVKRVLKIVKEKFRLI
ncbi:MAG: hypothetical protein ACR2MM_09090 [Flavobacteriaceae bacterium]